VRLSAESDRIHGAGAEVIAISVDDEVRQAGMFARWPTPNILYVADPGGETYLRPLDLFNPEERGGIGLPAVIVLAPDGRVVYEYVGRDFADRTTDAEVVETVESLGLAGIDPPPGGPVADVPDDLSGFFSPSSLDVFYRGNRFAAIAIGGRTDDKGFRAISREHRKMCEATLEAWQTLNS